MIRTQGSNILVTRTIIHIIKPSHTVIGINIGYICLTVSNMYIEEYNIKAIYKCSQNVDILHLSSPFGDFWYIISKFEIFGH